MLLCLNQSRREGRSNREEEEKESLEKQPEEWTEKEDGGEENTQKPLGAQAHMSVWTSARPELLQDAVKERAYEGGVLVCERWMSVCTNYGRSAKVSRSRREARVSVRAGVCECWCENIGHTSCFRR